jgi:hypothetical protein
MLATGFAVPAESRLAPVQKLSNALDGSLEVVEGGRV